MELKDVPVQELVPGDMRNGLVFIARSLFHPLYPRFTMAVWVNATSGKTSVEAVGRNHVYKLVDTHNRRKGLQAVCTPH